MRNLAKNLLLLLTLGAVLGYLGRRFPELAKGTDFVHFYSAARMVREGLGPRLYDLALQQQFQARYAGRAGTNFVHPPFETLIYLPFSIWTLGRAYLLWSTLNIALLLLTARLLQRHLFPDWDWRLMGLASFLFVPVLVNLQQGQDSILLLFLFVSAFAALRDGREFAAGCLLACGLFKFHFALPLFLMTLPGRTRRFSAGFASVAAVLVLVSVAISHWGVLVDYPRCLLHFPETAGAVLHPREEMANLRGLGALLSAGNARLGSAITWAGSLLIFWLAIRGWSGGNNKNADEDANLAWSNAVIGATLVGYHQSPCDLTLLLLPLVLVLHWQVKEKEILRPLRALLLGTALLLFLPPLHLALLSYHQYSYAAIPLLVLFAASYAEIRRSARFLPNR
jgi:hypothetical protein